MHTPPHLIPKLYSKALLAEVRTMPCSLRIGLIIGIPCSNTSSDPCHLPVDGKGMATKVTDLAVVAGCRSCHALLDMKDSRGIKMREEHPTAFWQRVLRGLVETQGRLVVAGIITVEGQEMGK